jgi:hypothetical protein
MRHYHSHRVKHRSFKEGDLVLCLVQDTRGRHKLSPPWEGPFIISKAVKDGSYYLIDIREIADRPKPKKEKPTRGKKRKK